MPKTLPMADETPIFNSVAIIGFGLIGGSLGLAIKQRWPKSIVVAVDRKDVLETAMRMGAADVAGDDLIMGKEAELVILAAPARENALVLAEIPGTLGSDVLVTDVGSTKRAITAAAHALPARVPFVGGHPLAGAAVSGVEAARADLFEGRPWILTSPATAGEDRIAKLESFIAALGATPRRMAASEHDLLLAYLSHLPQLTATALMHVVGGHAGADGLALAGRGLRDTTRLASSPAEIWRDIVATNTDNLATAIEHLIDTLQQLRLQLPEPRTEFDDLFASAGKWKRALEDHADVAR